MRGRCVLALIVLALGASADAELTESYPAQLTKAEMIALAKAACVSTHGVDVSRIDARTYTRANKGAAYALVECKSHDIFKEKPAHYVADCERTKREWTCSEAELEIVVSVGSRDIAVRPGTFAPELAYEIVSKIGAMGTFQGESLAEALGASCALRDGLDSELVVLECGGVAITLSLWCPQSACPRILSINRPIP